MPTVGKQISREPWDSAVLVETGASSNGARVVARTTVRVGGFRAEPHVHLLQDERFDVSHGRLAYRFGEHHGTVGPGESVTLPAGVPHEHYNAGDTEVELLHTVTPALDFDYFLENAYGLQGEGWIRGLPLRIQGLVWISAFRGPVLLASVPVGLQRAVGSVVAPVARLLGYRAVYQRFSGEEW